MDTIKCKECGKELNKKAEICPNCGCRVKSNTLKIVIICILTIVVICICCLCIKFVKQQIVNNNIKKEQEIKQSEFEILKKRVDSIAGTYTMPKENFNSFIKSLKNDGFEINPEYINIENDFTFTIESTNVPKYHINSKGTDYDGLLHSLKYNFDNDNNLYVRISLSSDEDNPLETKILSQNFNGLIECKFENNKLIQVDGRSDFDLDKKSYINNYGVIFNKIK